VAQLANRVADGRMPIETTTDAGEQRPLEDTKAATDAGKTLSVRERMEEHRKNPACTSCHRVIDPLGLALENFDVVGAWRIKDNGVVVDTAAKLYDGTDLSGPASLRQALLSRSDVFVRTMTEKLMTFGTGRGLKYYDMPAVRSIAKDAARNNNRYSSIILGIVKSDPFQMNQKAVDRAEQRAAR